MINLLPSRRRRSQERTAPPPEPSAIAQSAPFTFPIAISPSSSSSAASKSKKATSARRGEWIERLIAESFFAGIFGLVWLANGVFTVVGIASGFAWPVLGGLFGLVVHVGISRTEVTFWRKWRQPEYLLGLLGAAALDISTTLAGLLFLMNRYASWMLGGAPSSLWQWTEIFTAEKVPAWLDNALWLLLLAAAMALLSEFLVRRFWQNVQKTWIERA